MVSLRFDVAGMWQKARLKATLLRSGESSVPMVLAWSWRPLHWLRPGEKTGLLCFWPVKRVRDVVGTSVFGPSCGWYNGKNICRMIWAVFDVGSHYTQELHPQDLDPEHAAYLEAGNPFVCGPLELKKRNAAVEIPSHARSSISGYPTTMGLAKEKRNPSDSIQQWVVIVDVSSTGSNLCGTSFRLSGHTYIIKFLEPTCTSAPETTTMKKQKTRSQAYEAPA